MSQEDSNRDDDRDGHRYRRIAALMLLLLITFISIFIPAAHAAYSPALSTVEKPTVHSAHSATAINTATANATAANNAIADDSTTHHAVAISTPATSTSYDSSYTGPDFQTTATTNTDGTITVRVSVTGKQTTSTISSEANLIVLYDVTESMGLPVPMSAYSQSYFMYGSFDFSSYDLYAASGRFIKPVYPTYYPTYVFPFGWTSTSFKYAGTNTTVPYYNTIYITQKGNTDTRMTIANTAAKQLGETLLASGMNTSITLVPFKLNTFNEQTFTAGQSDDFNSALDDAANAGLYTTTGGQGTNWSSAFTEAQSIMQQHPDTPQSVVLISDGEPNNGTTNMNTLGKWVKTNITNQPNFQKFYTIYTSSEATTTMNTLATNTGATIFKGTSSEDIKHALNNIATEVKVSTSYDHVSISNTLGSSMSFPVANGVTQPQCSYLIRANGGAETAWSSAPAATVSGNGITWDLSSIGTLSPNTTYILQYTVLPQHQQLDAAAAAALSGRAQVTAGATASTTLVYTQTTQVGDAAPVSVQSSYNIPTQQSIPIAYATLTITSTFSANRTPPSTVTATVRKDGSAYTTVTLNSANGYTATVPVSINHTYTVQEEQPAGFTVTNPAALTLTGSPSQTQSLTITNTAIVNKLRIRYVDTTGGQETAVKNATFVVTHSATHAAITLTTDAQGYATSTEPLDDGTYTIAQSKVPAEYESLSNNYTLTIAGNTWTLLRGTRTITVSQPEFGIRQITLATQKIDETLPNAGGNLLWQQGIGFAVITASTTALVYAVIAKRNHKTTYAVGREER